MPWENILYNWTATGQAWTSTHILYRSILRKTVTFFVKHLSLIKNSLYFNKAQSLPSLVSWCPLSYRLSDGKSIRLSYKHGSKAYPYQLYVLPFIIERRRLVPWYQCTKLISLPCLSLSRKSSVASIRAHDSPGVGTLIATADTTFSWTLTLLISTYGNN
jgi:hypothetical protein